MAGTVAFDYRKMAREAAREMAVLKERLRIRKDQGPASPEDELIWRRDNSILYGIYLEQRCNWKEFTRRAERAEAIRSKCKV